MRRWISHLVIIGYLGALASGIAVQAMKFNHAANPLAYYFVWDMFCGWAAFECRYHLVAEGESGTYYWLSPSPWGEFHPYGDLARNHYDYYGFGLRRMAMNAVNHTDHEPLERILIVEECWPKKYNLPDHLWDLRFAEPKNQMSYFLLRNEFDGEGNHRSSQPDFLEQLFTNSIYLNPRLKEESMRGRPMFMLNPASRLRSNGSSGSTGSVSMESFPNAN